MTNHRKVDGLLCKVGEDCLPEKAECVIFFMSSGLKGQVVAGTGKIPGYTAGILMTDTVAAGGNDNGRE